MKSSGWISLMGLVSSVFFMRLAMLSSFNVSVWLLPIGLLSIGVFVYNFVPFILFSFKNRINMHAIIILGVLVVISYGLLSIANDESKKLYADTHAVVSVADEKEQEERPVNNEVKSESKVRITKEDFIVKNDIMYLPNEDKPYAGIYETYYPNGNKKGVAHIKDGKFDGLMTLWDESGQNKTEQYIKDGVDISEKKEYIDMTDAEKNKVKSDLNYMLSTATPEQINALIYTAVMPRK